MAKEPDMTTSEAVLPAGVLSAAEGLVTSLLEAEPIAAYHRASYRLDIDEEALTILERLNTVQTELRSKQASGLAPAQAEIERLRALSQEARSNQIIVDYVTAQQAAAAYLADINIELSQLLGLDFSTFASAGC